MRDRLENSLEFYRPPAKPCCRRVASVETFCVPASTARSTPAKPKDRPRAEKPAARGGWKRRTLRWGLIALLVILVLPIIQVGCVRVVKPPVTTLMLLRRLEGTWSSEYRGRIDYQWRPWQALPENFLRAAWVSEDARFFLHRGFDWKEIQAAMKKAERTGAPPRGSSTITQQCARTVFLWPGRSYVRKGLEAYYTVWMEWLLPKRRIFELYANTVELGDGIYGVAAAARRHFGRDANDLTPEQSAYLAAMLPAPRRWNPAQPSPRLRWRQRRILRDLSAAPPRWPDGVR